MYIIEALGCHWVIPLPDVDIVTRVSMLILAVTSQWARWCLEWMACRVFAQPFVPAQSKKTAKLRVTGLCEGNLPVTGGFPSQRASNVENISISWRHHVLANPGITTTTSVTKPTYQLWTHIKTYVLNINDIYVDTMIQRIMTHANSVKFPRQRQGGDFWPVKELSRNEFNLYSICYGDAVNSKLGFCNSYNCSFVDVDISISEQLSKHNHSRAVLAKFGGDTFSKTWVV